MINNYPIVIILLLLTISPIFNIIKHKYSIIITSIILIAGLFIIDFNITDYAYVFGNWPEILGIKWEITTINNITNYCFMLIALYILFCIKSLIENNTNQKKILTLWVLLIAGCLSINLSDDLFNIYVFIEIISISSYPLIVNKKDSRSFVASFNYLIIGTISGCIYLIFVAVLYNQTGHLNIDKVSSLLNNNISLNLAAILLIISLLQKLAIFPFSGWIIDVYQHGSKLYAITSSSIINKVFLLIFIKLITQLSFLREFIIINQNILLYLLAVSLIYSSVALFISTKLMQIVAWSSIINNNYLLIFIILNIANITSPNMLNTILLFILGDSIIKLGFIKYVSNLEKLDIYKIDQLSFLSFKNFNNKFLALTWIFLLVATPPSALFLAKYNLLKNSLAFSYYYGFAILFSILISMIVSIKIFMEGINNHNIDEKDKILVTKTNNPLAFWLLSSIVIIFINNITRY